MQETQFKEERIIISLNPDFNPTGNKHPNTIKKEMKSDPDFLELSEDEQKALFKKVDSLISTMDDIKKKLVGHWGTVPGQNFIYTHLNRIIKKYDLSMIYISGPGHGGNAMIANTYLEGTYSEVYPNITEDEEGMKKLFKQFSFPGGVSSHVAPETPGSINEGGELGYSLAHAYGAVMDNPSLIAACIVGDGEAETGPLATSWH